MSHCAKCGTELIGSKKFCATCGAPAVDPRSPVASTGPTPVAAGSAPAIAPAPSSSQDNVYGSASAASSGPVSQVNPFAQTAGPGMRMSDYGPPPTSLPPELASTAPGLGASARPSQLSPLASSNVHSERGAFATAGGSAIAQAAQQAVEQSNARPSMPSPSGAAAPSHPAASNPAASDPAMGVTAPSGSPDPVAPKKIPGTQIMPSLQNPSLQNPPVISQTPSQQADPAAQPPKKHQGTFVMQVPPKPPAVTPTSQPSVPAAQSVQPQQSVQPPQPSIQQPPPVQPPPVQQPPQQAWGQQPEPPPPQQAWGQQPAQPPQQQAWGQQPPQPLQPVSPYASPYAVAPAPAAQTAAPAPPPPGAYQYGFGYAPGSRVNVTWSNGHRYPGTVQQVSGAQCLVIFPDGQQHWVEMQYVAPA